MVLEKVMRALALTVAAAAYSLRRASAACFTRIDSSCDEKRGLGGGEEGSPNKTTNELGAW